MGISVPRSFRIGASAACAAAALPALFFAMRAVTGVPSRSGDGAVVVMARGSNFEGIGAGSVVSVVGGRVRIITAMHVAVYGPLTVRFGDGSQAPATIVKLVPGNDLALVDANVDPAVAMKLHVAPVGRPQASERIHVWGSGINGPALEPGAILATKAELPDGPARGRYVFDCHLCHEGDSGGGVFTANGTLVGVFIGYFSVTDGRMAIAELPLDENTITSLPAAATFVRLGALPPGPQIPAARTAQVQARGI